MLLETFLIIPRRETKKINLGKEARKLTQVHDNGIQLLFQKANLLVFEE